MIKNIEFPVKSNFYGLVFILGKRSSKAAFRELPYGLNHDIIL